MSNQASAHALDGDFYSVVTSPELLQCCDTSLQVSEVWVVWEPVGQVARQKLLQEAVNALAKHSLLVFVLERGQVLYGSEYRYMRVERQQDPAAAKAALLTIRFCRHPVVVQGLDIPGLTDEQRQQLTPADLQQHQVKQLPEQRAQLSAPADETKAAAACLLLDTVIQAVLSVHESRPEYCLAEANCMWFVKRVLRALAASTQHSELEGLAEEFSSSMRYLAAGGLKPVVSGARKVVEALQRKQLVIACRPADAAVLSRGIAASAALSSHGVVNATAAAFKRSNWRSTRVTRWATEWSRVWWGWCCSVLLLVMPWSALRRSARRS